MPAVPDLSGNNPPVMVQPYSHTNRFVATAPSGSLLPLYRGEIVSNSADGLQWRAEGLTVDTWVRYNI